MDIKGSEKKIVGYLAVTLGSLSVCLLTMLALFYFCNDLYKQAHAANAPPSAVDHYRPASTPLLELLDAHWKNENNLRSLVVTVKSISPVPIVNFQARPVWWTKDGKMVERTSQTGNPRYLPLQPGEISTFSIRVYAIHPEASYGTLIFEDGLVGPSSEIRTIAFKDSTKAQIAVPTELEYKY